MGVVLCHIASDLNHRQINSFCFIWHTCVEYLVQVPLAERLSETREWVEVVLKDANGTIEWAHACVFKTLFIFMLRNIKRAIKVSRDINPENV